jgi:hypothetical protein
MPDGIFALSIAAVPAPCWPRETSVRQRNPNPGPGFADRRQFVVRPRRDPSVLDPHLPRFITNH